MSLTGSNKFTTRSIATIAMLCAIAFVAKLISNVFPVVSGFLSFDLKDVVIVIGGFILGPLAAGLITLIVSVIEMLTISSTGPIGLVMNVLSSCAFACVAASFYRKYRNIRGAILGLILGTLCMTAIMLLWNYLITPLYMKVPREVVIGMLVPVFLPFNLVKGGINAALALLLYKPIVTALRKAGLVEESASGKGSAKWSLIVIAGVLLVTFILFALVLAGVL